jgi:hypothetical protein
MSKHLTCLLYLYIIFIESYLSNHIYRIIFIESFLSNHNKKTYAFTKIRNYQKYRRTSDYDRKLKFSKENWNYPITTREKINTRVNFVFSKIFQYETLIIHFEAKWSIFRCFDWQVSCAEPRCATWNLVSEMKVVICHWWDVVGDHIMMFFSLVSSC